MGISARQSEILEFIKTYTKDYGYAPTVREIGEGVGLKSPSSVVKHLNKLEISGCIRRSPDKPRTIEILGGQRTFSGSSLQIPLLKRVSQDVQLMSKDNIRDYYSFPSSSFSGKTFAIEAPDDSMEDIGIRNGSIVFVSSSGGVEGGELVVCLVNNTMLIRYIYLEPDGGVRLESSNHGEQRVGSCRVVGIVCGYYNNIA